MNTTAVETQRTGSQSSPKSALEVVVLYTDSASTLPALRTASQLAQGLFAKIRVLALHCVPYPLPLEEPAVDRQFQIARLSALADTCIAGENCVVDIRLCRDPWVDLKALLAPGSVVVIGKRSRWLPHPEDWLARRLRNAGHHVVRTGGGRHD